MYEGHNQYNYIGRPRCMRGLDWWASTTNITAVLKQLAVATNMESEHLLLSLARILAKASVCVGGTLMLDTCIGNVELVSIFNPEINTV